MSYKKGDIIIFHKSQNYYEIIRINKLTYRIRSLADGYVEFGEFNVTKKVLHHISDNSHVLRLHIRVSDRLKRWA